MPEVASATLTVTPVLAGAQQSLTDQLTGEATKAGETAGAASGKSMAGSLAKGLAAGSVAVAGAVAGVGAALVGTASKTAEYGDQIDKASQKLGVSSTFYQEWEAVLQHSGTSMDSMSATFKKLATASQDASDDQVKAFEALGLSMEDVSSMSAEDLFTHVISGLQNMEEGTERTALATELLGKGAMEMGALLNTSSEDTQAMIDRVHELGGVMDEDAVKGAAAFQDELQDMKTSFAGIKNGLAADLLPVLTSFMGSISDFISNTDLSPITDMFKKAFDALANFVGGLDIEAIGNTFQTVVSAIGTIVETVWGVLSTIFDALKNAFTKVSDALGESETNWDDVWGGISEIMSGAGQVIADVIGVIADAIAWLVTEAQTDGTLINAVWEGIQTAIETLQNHISGVIDFVSALLNGDWAAAWEAARGIVDNITGAIGTICSDTWDAIKKTASDVWEGIKSAITEPIETAKEKVGEIIEKIKGFFHFDFQLPSIKLPHFSVQPPGWSLGDLLKGSIPSLGIEWYAKGGVVDSPTLIGAGEAGPEAVIPLSGQYMQPFAKAIAAELGTGRGVVNYITVNGAEDPEAWASKFARQIKLEMRMA